MSVKFDKKKFEKQLRQAARSIDYDRLGRFTVNRVKKVVRSGISPVTEQPFKPLKKSTIRRRENLSAINRTHPRFSPAFSNLTFTGQLLNALTYLIEKKTLINKIRVMTEDSIRKPYRGVDELPKNNKQVQQSVEEERPYMGLDSIGEDELRQIVINELEKQLKKLNR